MATRSRAPNAQSRAVPTCLRNAVGCRTDMTHGPPLAVRRSPKTIHAPCGATAPELPGRAAMSNLAPGGGACSSQIISRARGISGRSTTLGGRSPDRRRLPFSGSRTSRFDRGFGMCVFRISRQVKSAPAFRAIRREPFRGTGPVDGRDRGSVRPRVVSEGLGLVKDGTASGCCTRCDRSNV